MKWIKYLYGDVLRCRIDEKDGCERDEGWKCHLCNSSLVGREVFTSMMWGPVGILVPSSTPYESPALLTVVHLNIKSLSRMSGGWRRQTLPFEPYHWWTGCPATYQVRKFRLTSVQNELHCRRELKFDVDFIIRFSENFIKSEQNTKKRVARQFARNLWSAFMRRNWRRWRMNKTFFYWEK